MVDGGANGDAVQLDWAPSTPSADLFVGLRWLIRLRWISAAALVVAVPLLYGLGHALAYLPAFDGATHFDPPYTALLAFAGVGCALNGAHIAIANHLDKSDPAAELAARLQAFVAAQLAIDIVLVAALAHLSGGIESPAGLFIVFHIIAATSLLSARWALGLAVFATGLLGCMANLELYGVIAHHSLFDSGKTWNLHADPDYVAMYLLIAASILMAVVILASHSTGRARRSEQALKHRVVELSSFYSIARLLGSEPDLDDIAERVMKRFRVVFAIRGYALIIVDPDTGDQAVRSSFGSVPELVNGDAFVEDIRVVPSTAEHGPVVHIPITIGDNRVGRLVVHNAPEQAATEVEIALLRTIATNFGLAAVNTGLYQQLEREAITDGLTGLANHRELYRRLDLELARASRSDRLLSVILLDIDHFKSFNDRFGHVAGDQLLRELARLLESSVRAGDVVARYGGEEFAALLPETDRDTAAATAKRIRERVDLHTFSDALPVEARSITVSVGVHTVTPAATPANGRDVMKRVDGALYAAKDAGRNRVMVAQ